MIRTKDIGGTLVGLTVVMVGSLLPSACAAPVTDAEAQGSTAQSSTTAQASTAQAADAQARESWRDAIARNPSPLDGCFHSSYPSMDWAPVDCAVAPKRPFLPRHSASTPVPATVGDGNDFAATVTGLITQSVGTFPTVTGVTKETDSTSNTYSIQLNSNFMSKARCHTISGCQAWEQFVYSSSSQEAFMQYWLIGQGTCPSGDWMSDGDDCYMNSAGVTVPQLAISGLSTMKMSGTAVRAGNNTLVFTADGDAYSTSGKDSVVELALDWNASEFNIIGDGDGSEAVFNTGSSITVKIAVTDGTTTAPTCTSNGGTTGETNNLTLGTCTAEGGATPYIQFTEKK
jgi:hypothetical protein